MDYLKELKVSELKKIEGGKNFLEYAAQGVGYVVGMWEKHSVSSDIVAQSSAC